MPERDLMQLLAEDLLRKGKAAHKAGDAGLLRSCLAELDRRLKGGGSSLARDCAERLRQLNTPSRAPRTPKARMAKLTEQPPTSEPVPGIRVLVDAQDIMAERLRLIASAQRSIWLSSYTFPNDKVVEGLVHQARAGVQVRLIVAEKNVRQEHGPAVARLERASVECEFPQSCHAKALVIDERTVLNGSANAHGGHHDICEAYDSPSAARKIVAELERLFEGVPSSYRK
jgi:hypothetical protein